MQVSLTNSGKLSKLSPGEKALTTLLSLSRRSMPDPDPDPDRVPAADVAADPDAAPAPEPASPLAGPAPGCC
jgi:hypothetical protein